LFDFVDYIIIYDDDTPLNVLRILTPDILIKGSDYNIENIVGKEFSKKILFFNLINDKSSSIIIAKIKNSHNNNDLQFS
jgi:D-beta-D-heptose 7-phosphate kinase/D-beta-D-heptose 1-phosphate adenosyltransferase